jgi:CheY-like chemotaxis protein
MPEMGGLEAAEIIRADTALTEQPRIVAVTANAFAEDRVKCLQVIEVMMRLIKCRELWPINYHSFFFFHHNPLLP